MDCDLDALMDVLDDDDDFDVEEEDVDNPAQMEGMVGWTVGYETHLLGFKPVVNHKKNLKNHPKVLLFWVFFGFSYIVKVLIKLSVEWHNIQNLAVSTHDQGEVIIE